MNVTKAIEAFEKQAGTIEDYGNDKILWREHFGTFLLGWLACEKDAKQSVVFTAFFVIWSSIVWATFLTMVFSVIIDMAFPSDPHLTMRALDCLAGWLNCLIKRIGGK